jgi:succinate dehydrogenase / fumarate reductase iron-sulfur subunit
MAMKKQSEKLEYPRYEIKVLRYDAVIDKAKQPYFQTYELDDKTAAGMTVLDALLYIQDYLDGTLSFRYSCRGAICGSCSLSMNGFLNLACRSHLANLGPKITVEPLPNLEIIKDLTVDMEPFWRAYDKVQPYLQEALGKETPEKEWRVSVKERKRMDDFVNCILCATCYGACPVFDRHQTKDYLGPAALTKLYRFLIDSRDHRSGKVLDMVNDEKGAWGCDTVHRCVKYCPKDVGPTYGVVGVRRELVKHKLKRLVGKGK